MSYITKEIRKTIYDPTYLEQSDTNFTRAHPTTDFVFVDGQIKEGVTLASLETIRARGSYTMSFTLVAPNRLTMSESDQKFHGELDKDVNRGENKTTPYHFTFLINPENLSLQNNNLSDSDYTRNGNRVFLGGRTQVRMTAAGTSAAFMLPSAGLAGPGGISRPLTRLDSEGYRNIKELVRLYKNNGYQFLSPQADLAFESIPGFKDSPRVIHVVSNIRLTYGGVSYEGHFNSLNITDSALNPHNFKYSFEFIVSGLSTDFYEGHTTVLDNNNSGITFTEQGSLSTITSARKLNEDLLSDTIGFLQQGVSSGLPVESSPPGSSSAVSAAVDPARYNNQLSSYNAVFEKRLTPEEAAIGRANLQKALPASGLSGEQRRNALSIYDNAVKYGVDPVFALNIATNESSLGANKNDSKVGARGVYQITAATAKDAGVDYTLLGSSIEYDTAAFAKVLRLKANTLSKLSEKNGADSNYTKRDFETNMLVTYNAGEGYVPDYYTKTLGSEETGIGLQRPNSHFYDETHPYVTKFQNRKDTLDEFIQNGVGRKLR